MATKGMTHQKDTELRDALITLLRQSGIAVSTNVPEAERILQENRNRIHREHQINTDPVLNGVISVFSKKYQLPVEIVRSYFEGMGNEDLLQAQQAYYAIRRAYRENVKTELGDGFKLSAFSEKFAALKNELYNVFGDVDALRDREVQKAQDYRNMMDAARREAERKLQAEYDRLQPYRDMSDTEIDDLYMRTLPHEVIEQYSVTEKQAAIDTLADDQKALLTDLLTVMQERRGYTSTTDYQGQGAWVAPGDPGYATDKERRANVLEDGGDVNIEDIAKGITPQPEDYFSNLRAYGHNTKQGTESARAIRTAIETIQNGGNVPTVRAYRAVPKDIEEGMFRNGDWVTMSPEYAKIHGELRFGIDNYRVIQHDVPANKLWWDGNDINEWGFDDGQGYRYKNTLHNRKSDSLVTFDDKGKVIPLSKRYDERTADIRYMYATEVKRPVFISNAQMALDKIKQDKASPMQWLKMLQKNGGIKAGEDRWTGLSEWLQESTEKSLTRQQIEQYLADNHIRLEEVHYYEGLPQQAQDKLDAYNEEFNELIMEGEEQTGSLYTSDWVDWAFATMLERYGDDFYQAFEIGEGTGTDSKLTPIEDYNGELSDQAKHFLGFDDDKIKQINNVRLEYTSDGLENKREIALTVPSVEGWNISDSVHFGDADNGTAIAWVRFGDTTIKKELSPEEKAAAIEQMPKADQWELVDGSHFTNRNDVYFAPDPKNNTRFGRDYIYHKKDQMFGQFFIELSSSYRGLSIPPRYGFDSLEEAVNEYNRWKVNQIHREERILVIDEIQSKRHQEGREKGYAVSEEKATREMDTFLSKMKDKYHYSPQTPFNEIFNDSELKELQRLNQQQYNASFNHSAVPDAPFEKNWQELAMKRMLRYAAENGYDRLAWLNGLQQAERYSLGGKVDSIYIDHSRNNPERYSVTTYAPDTGIISPASPNEATKEDLHEIFGKNIAEQLLDGLADLDQKKERGETYRNKSFVLEGKDLEVGGEGMKAFYDRILPNFMNKYGKQWGVQVEPMDIPSLQIKDLDYGRGLHSVRITGLMNRDVMEGQPMFFRDGEDNIYGFLFDETVYIDPRIATAEVPIHEYAHLWAAVMRQQNPDEWTNIVSLMKDVPELWQNVEKQYAGSVDQPGSWKHLLDRNIISQERYDSWIADEVLAMYSGHRGYERLAALTEGKENGMEILQKVKEILKRFWHSIAENYLHIHYDSKEQVADQIMKDLLSKVNPLDLKTRPVTGLHLRNYEERQIDSRNFKEWLGNWKQPTIFTAYNVNDSKSLQQKYPSELPNKFYHHSTVSFGQQPFNTKEGEQKQLHITGRLTTDKVDVLIVENPESNNAVPHITLATAKGVKPAEANNELSQHLTDIIPMDDYVSTTFRNNLDRNMSKVVDSTGQPLMVEHGTYQNFTVFDKEKNGSNSKDEGLFGTGFYFANQAPAWLGRETTVPEGVTILTEVEELKDIFKKAEPTTKDVAVLKKWLNSHKDNTVRLYHGTDADIPVKQEGLKKTSSKTRRSLQSGTGNVYLTPFPTFAKAFGQFAYPDKENIAVYAVDVKVKDLHADKDQLKNKRMAGIDIGDSLAASLLAGHSATVRRNIATYELQRHTDFHVMKVFLDIKRPFKIQDTVHLDMYGQIRDKMDSPAFRELTVRGFNDRQTTVGEYIDQIKAVDRLIAEGRHTEMMKQDPELQFIHPKEQLRVWREHEISRRTGFILPLSWQVLIAEQIGSRQFTAAAQKDRYDGVIVDRAYGEKEYVAFEPSQIKSATDNIGLFSRENNDIRFMKTTTEKEISKAVIHKGRGNTLLVRAEINGREQPSRELSKKDAASFRSGKTTAENLARKYFSETIDRVYKSNINR